MTGKNKRILAKCPLFACRVCRTKTGWPHQSWCENSNAIRPGCGECRYRREITGACGHPARKRRAWDEKSQHPV